MVVDHLNAPLNANDTWKKNGYYYTWTKVQKPVCVCVSAIDVDLL